MLLYGTETRHIIRRNFRWQTTRKKVNAKTRHALVHRNQVASTVAHRAKVQAKRLNSIAIVATPNAAVISKGRSTLLTKRGAPGRLSFVRQGNQSSATTSKARRLRIAFINHYGSSLCRSEMFIGPNL